MKNVEWWIGKRITGEFPELWEHCATKRDAERLLKPYGPYEAREDGDAFCLVKVTYETVPKKATK